MYLLASNGFPVFWLMRMRYIKPCVPSDSLFPEGVCVPEGVVRDKGVGVSQRVGSGNETSSSPSPWLE